MPAESNAAAAPLPEIIGWRAPTHEKGDRSTDWYWALGIIGVCGALAAVLLGNVLFAVIIGVGALSLGVLVAREPREHDVRIEVQGITVDGDFYPWESLRSFWVAPGRNATRLFVTTGGIVHPHLVLAIHEPADPQDVYDYLSIFLPEEESHSLGTLAAELLGL